MLSPVLLVGPSSVALSKPVVLTFRHCASVRHGQWTLSLIGSNSSIDEPLHWQVGCVEQWDDRASSSLIFYTRTYEDLRYFELKTMGNC